jgi:Fe-S cluster assembly protein SufD
MFKTVAADQARASVDGTIIVALDAQQTNAGQLINNLMLSDEARADAKPRLMIHADDVKCSHGATAGKLDPVQQFYLESRGLPPEQARSLLTVAFVAEALEKAGKAGEPFRDALDHALLDSLRTRLPGGSHA